MNKCIICGDIASHKLTPYTGTTPETAVYYCTGHVLHVMENETVKTFKLEKLPHVYGDLKIKLSNGSQGGYIK